MGTRKASIKETGEELSQEEWERFDRAVETEGHKRPKEEPFERDAAEREPDDAAAKPEASTRRV